MYAFISRDEGRACVILRVEESTYDSAIRALKENGIEILDGSRIYAL